MTVGEAGLWQELPHSAKSWIPINESPLSAGREGSGVSPEEHVSGPYSA